MHEQQQKDNNNILLNKLTLYSDQKRRKNHMQVVGAWYAGLTASQRCREANILRSSPQPATWLSQLPSGFQLCSLTVVAGLVRHPLCLPPPLPCRYSLHLSEKLTYCAQGLFLDLHHIYALNGFGNIYAGKVQTWMLLDL